ncbi:NB-ARC domains-containing protein [Tanacetum coccineum]|uniref:NB-ARC domains-containing protein n=1 Tax=Tanacetum coccineum TaxID=301880 RepID=A0ABQ4XSY3_9ASTR
MKLRYCCNLTTTPDFSEITNLEELSLEGCLNLDTFHPSIGMLKRLVAINLSDCKRLRSFPSNLKMDKLPADSGRIKTLVELHIDGTAITERPGCSSVFCQSRWWTHYKKIGLL